MLFLSVCRPFIVSNPYPDNPEIFLATEVTENTERSENSEFLNYFQAFLGALCALCGKNILAVLIRIFRVQVFSPG
jgi:hypothetical protein